MIKYQLKLTLSLSTIMIASVFTCAMFVLPVSSMSNLVSLVDVYVSFLAIILFSTIYYSEIQHKTAENYYFTADNKKIIDQSIKILLKFILLMTICLIIFFVNRALRDPYLMLEVTEIKMFIDFLCVTSSSMILWGMLSCTFVRLFRNLLGMGMAMALWSFVTSSRAEGFPLFLNVFAYHKRDVNFQQVANWEISIITKLICTVIMLYFHLKNVNKSPC